jgi:hypothetical protein
MAQRDLNRAVARATGETVSEIAHRGFVPLTTMPYEREGATDDWDEQDAQRNVCLFPRRKRAPAAV